jgi:hypothetical protein
MELVRCEPIRTAADCVFDPKRRRRIQLKGEGIERADSTPGEFAVPATFGTLLSVTVKPALFIG